jgi:hypothetical protein
MQLSTFATVSALSRLRQCADLRIASERPFAENLLTTLRWISKAGARRELHSALVAARTRNAPNFVMHCYTSVTGVLRYDLHLSRASADSDIKAGRRRRGRVRSKSLKVRYRGDADGGRPGSSQSNGIAHAA